MKFPNTFSLLLVLTVFVPSPARAEEGDLQFFENRIRPALATHCYTCHGPQKQKANLRLDHISQILTGGDTGPAIVPGDPAASRLFTAVHYEDVDLQMPPSGRLPDELIADFEKWIKLGAPWPDEPFNEAGAARESFDVELRRTEHWAWQPMAPVAPPAPAAPDWVRDPVDHFILQGLDRQGLQPAPEADRAALLRRLHFDIVGLPPTPREIDTFIADESPAAYEKRVDALLDSPAFGERWGRHWLDLTRYAETHGHEGDYAVPHAWQYRDYVIRAFNSDIPYDQLVREHIAGDLLASPRLDANGLNESQIATGFWFMYQATHGPVDVKLDHADRIDNQIDVMTKTFTAMTVSCARCHDHKFDAISDEDYYALSGILRSTRPRIALQDPGLKIQQAVEELRYQHDRGTRLIHQALSRVDASQRIADYILGAQSVLDGAQPSGVAESFRLDPDHLERWRRALRDRDNRDPGHPLYTWAKLTGMTEEEPRPDQPPATPPVIFEDFDAPLQEWTREGEAFPADPGYAASWRPAPRAPQLTPAGVAHSGVYGDHLQGVLRSPVFTLDCDHIYIRAAGKKADVKLVIENYTLRDANALLFEETAIAPASDRFEWYQMRHRIDKFRGCRAYFEIRDYGDGYIAVDEIRFANGAQMPGSDSWRLLDEYAGPAPSLTKRAAAYEAAFIEAAQRWQQGTARVSEAGAISWLLEFGLIQGTSSAARLEALARDYRDRARQVPAPVHVLAMDEGTPENQPLFIRGNYKTPGELIERRFLQALDSAPEPYSDGSGRLALAEALTHPQNPLVARVFVNRVWHHLFGAGIVKSVDNFGVLGEKPSHPELLDYLAQRFIDSGWSIKSLIRDLVCTTTYRMSSAPLDPVAEEKDPANLWLHRMPMKRLQGEVIRDSILAVADTLNPEMHGPSVPAWISPFVKNIRAPKTSGPMDAERRRSIYMEVRRNFLSPMLTAFDFPLPDTSHGKRNISNVPAQALILMNDPFVIEQAQQWCARLMKQEPLATRRIRRAYEEALGRKPTAAEVRRAIGFLEAQAREYGLPPEQALQNGQVWTDLCHVLFMSKEFIFIG